MGKKDDFDIAVDGTAEAPLATSEEPRQIPQVEKVEKATEVPKNDVMVTIDIPFESVLKYDHENRVVRFSCEPDKFLRLSDAEIDRLSGFTRGAYLDAERTVAKAIAEAANPSFIKGDISQMATGHDQIEVLNKKPGMFYRWWATRNVRRATRLGYKVSSDDALDTFRRGPSSVRTVGQHGDPEAVLMETPLAARLQREKKSGELSRKRVLGAKASAIADLKSKGATVYDPDENPKADEARKWRNAGEAPLPRD